MKKFFIFLFIFFLLVNYTLGALEPGTGGGGGTNGGSEDPFYSILNFFREPFASTLKCGEGANSALQKLIRCAFDILELLKSLALILMVIAFFGAAIYLISTPFFGLKNVAIAWRILIWTPVGIVIVLLGDLIKDQIERIIFGP
ncbi:hypothetical protein HRbin35_00464 [bacterium HR35]|nr:hypothetical protein HRbin35_00464 [bacterium HR35]